MILQSITANQEPFHIINIQQKGIIENNEPKTEKVLNEKEAYITNKP